MTVNRATPLASPVRRVELLAPAGDLDSAWAAFHFGADAVYLGLKQFSARAEAQNFTLAQLSEVLAYARSLRPPRRVYVTLNTLVLEHEQEAIVRLLLALERLSVDALIVQDVGVCRLVRQFFPGLRLHASTQMAIHNLAGTLVAQRLGCSRVTLARELTLREIRRISAGAGVETEVFLHGALCYAYSGLCLFSSLMLGRSGNRGRCAYPCRGRFTDGTSWKYPFSMKDLAVASEVHALVQAGVSALKIEGRMKNALYVAAVTRYYRGLLDGTLSPDDLRAAEEDIQTIFSRPWTSLYLRGKRPKEPVIDAVHLGHQGLAIGEIVEVRRCSDGDWMVFRSQRTLERHDGLQVALPRGGKLYGFAVTELRLRGDGHSRVRTDPYRVVEVRLPPHHPPIPVGSLVYLASSQEVRRRYRHPRPRPGAYRMRTPITVHLRLTSDRIEVTASVPSASELSARVEMSGEFPAARSPARTEVAIREAFGRLGTSEWQAASIKIHNPEGRWVPPSLLNAARRRLAEALTASRVESEQARWRSLQESLHLCPRKAEAQLRGALWSLKVASFESLRALQDEDWAALQEVVVVLDAGDNRSWEEELRLLVDRCSSPQLRLAFPVILREADAGPWTEMVRRLWRAGYRRWEVSHLSGFSLLRRIAHELKPDRPRAGAPSSPEVSELDLTADWPCYSLNSLAIAAWQDLGATRVILSPEDTRTNLLRLISRFGERVLVPYFLVPPLFLSATWPPAWNSCGSSSVRVWDGHHQEYQVHRQGDTTVVTPAIPFCLGRHRAELFAAGAVGFRVDCAYALLSAEEIRDLFRTLREGGVPTPHRDGNYERGLL